MEAVDELEPERDQQREAKKGEYAERQLLSDLVRVDQHAYPCITEAGKHDRQKREPGQGVGRAIERARRRER
ncbi:hypothetical protein GCM10022253_05760 [Sphingomonas endophytica]